jgi:hypothetical protein
MAKSVTEAVDFVRRLAWSFVCERLAPGCETVDPAPRKSHVDAAQ